MAAIAAIGLAISGAASLAQAIRGEKRRKDAQRALERFQRQELRNVTEGLSVSTLGAELQTQEARRRFATSVEALRSGGVRALVGGLQGQERYMQDFQRQIAADLDRQAREIGLLGAQDQARIRAMQEARESAQIAGLGMEAAAGRRQAQAGLSGLVSTGIAGAQIAAAGGFGDGSGGESGEGSGSDAGGKQTSALALGAPTSYQINFTSPTASPVIQPQQQPMDVGRSYFGRAFQGGVSPFEVNVSPFQGTSPLKNMTPMAPGIGTLNQYSPEVADQTWFSGN
jgi:hypothetical protein